MLLLIALLSAVAYLVIPTVLEVLKLPPVSVIVRYVNKVRKELWFQLICFSFLVKRAFAFQDEISFLKMLCYQIIEAVEAINSVTEVKVVKFILFLSEDVAGVLLLSSSLCWIYNLLCFRLDLNKIKELLKSTAFDVLSQFSFVKEELQREEEKMVKDLEQDLKDQTRTKILVLPKNGIDSKTLINELEGRSKSENKKWESGKVSGTVYLGEKNHTELLNKVYAIYSLSNPLHTDIWPSVNSLEAEVVSMTASLVNGGNSDVVGCTSSGGTESIILAVKAHRDYYRQKGIVKPEVISCFTAHAGIEKACDMLNVKNVKVPFNKDSFQIDLKAVKRAINSNTIMLYGSAPNYPQGAIDPIKDLSLLAERHSIGLHVDCCLGGFVLPFAKLLGYDIPDFDFALSGVSSMSCDTHKYGYGAKGTSVILYRNKELRRAQYFAYPEWMGGLYATPTIAGSRSGALLACAWASMMSMGQDGFIANTKKIMDATRYIASEVACIQGLKVLGGSKAMIVCVASDVFNIYRVVDLMSTLGWSLNSLQRPACFHICVTVPVANAANLFLKDLSQVTKEVLANPNDKGAGTAAVYGKTGSLPEGPVSGLLKTYLDVVLSP